MITVVLLTDRGAQLTGSHHSPGMAHQYLDDRCFLSRLVHDVALDHYPASENVKSRWANDKGTLPLRESLLRWWR